MQGQQQEMAALLARIQGTDASVTLIGHAVSNIPGTAFAMPAPTAAVAGYGGGGGAIAAATETSAAMAVAAGAGNATMAETELVDPRMIGAPYLPYSPTAPRGAGGQVDAPVIPVHSGRLDDGGLPAGTSTAVETRPQRLQRLARYSARLLAAPLASAVTRRTELWERRGRRRTGDAPPGWRARRRLKTTTSLRQEDSQLTKWTCSNPTPPGCTIAGGGEPSVPGMPMMCLNHARYNRASFMQKNYPVYCCDECAHSAGFKHAVHCALRSPCMHEKRLEK